MDESEAVDGDAPGNEVWTPEDLDLVEVWPLEGQPAHASVAEQAARAIQPLLVRMDPLAQEPLELKEVTVLLPIVGAMGEVVKEHVCDVRTWGFRLAGGAAAVTAATVGGKKAGLAMLGTAVAVPLLVVFGAGAAFAGQGRGCASPGGGSTPS